MDYISLKNSIILSIDGEQTTIPSTDPRFEVIRDKINKVSDEEILRILNMKKSFENDLIKVKDGLIYYKEKPVPSFLGDNFYSFKIQEKPLMGLINFWFNLQSRCTLEEAKNIVQDLVEKNAYSFTDDGFIFVYDSEHCGYINSDYFYSYSNTPKSFKKYFERKISFENLIDIYFEKNTKKLKKVLTKKCFYNNKFNHKPFLVGALLKGYLSLENIIACLDLDFPIFTESEIEGCHLIFEKLTEKKIFSLIKKGNLRDLKYLARILIDNIETNEVQEVLAQIKTRKFKDFTEIKKFFDELSMYWGKEKKDLNQEELNPILKNLKLELKDDIKIEIPKTNFDLLRYSYILGHCIGTHGYDELAIKGEKILLAIYQKNELLYNVDVDIKRKEVRQFRGKGNRSIHGEKSEERKKMKRLVYHELQRAGIIIHE